MTPVQATLMESPAVKELRTVEDGLSMFERFAKDPDIPVEKIERLMALWERGEARKAEAAFNVAMSEAQSEMRPVVADDWNPQTKSKYASYHALDKALRPIYTKHGFGLSFNTMDSPVADHVRVVCKAAHKGGHCEVYQIDMPADGKGAKGGDVMTKTHATGSALSYGQRYLLKLIFNVAVTEDDDGNKASGRPQPTKPNGFDEWVTDMGAVADNGFKAFSEAWGKSKPEYRDYAAKYHEPAFKAMKARAIKVQA